MTDDVLDFVRKKPAPDGLAGRLPPAGRPDEAEEGACAAFGYLRGLHEKALAVEFRLRDGDREWLPYSCLVSWRHNPSAGLLLKFTGDVVTLVFIRGSNLDAPVNQGGVNLTDRGLQRHRVTYIREMSEDELRQAGEGEPTIDGIDIAEFESGEELRAWVKQHAPAFER